MNKNSSTSPPPCSTRTSTRRHRELIANGAATADQTLALAPSGREPLESDIQHRLIDRARARGCLVRKLVAMAYRGFPDLLIIRGGVILFVEVKRRKGVVTHVQRLEHMALTEAGAHIEVTFGLYEAFAVLDRWFP